MPVDPFALTFETRLGRDALLDRFLKYGILTSSDEDIREIRRLIEDKAPGEWPRWREVLVSAARWTDAPTSMADLSVDDLVPRGAFDTAYVVRDEVSERLCAALAADAPGGCHLLREDPAVEVVRLAALFNSELLNEREAWSTGGLAEGEPRGALWRRLSALFATATHVRILDRYIFGCASGALASDAKYTPIDWLFDQIAQCPAASKLNIELFGSVPDPPFDTADHFDRLVEHLWTRTKGRVSNLRLFPGEAVKVHNVLHHRALRFTVGKLGRMVKLDHSFSALTPYIDSPVNMTYEVLSPDRTKECSMLEQRLETIAGQALGSFSRSAGTL
jgi:hypothetical protein